MVWAWQGSVYPAWEQTACILSMLHNANADPKKGRLKTPQDFFKRPGSKRTPRGTPLTGETLRGLKSAFTKKRG